MSTFETTALLTATKSVTLLLGALITWLAYKAYRRTGSPAIRSLSVGFGLVTLGAVLGGVLHQSGTRFALSQNVQSLFTAAGFVVLVYSLYGQQTADRGADPQRAGSPVMGATDEGGGCRGD
jgi:O-antigen/teichoic acid export membrane protein